MLYTLPPNTTGLVAFSKAPVTISRSSFSVLALVSASTWVVRMAAGLTGEKQAKGHGVKANALPTTTAAKLCLEVTVLFRYRWGRWALVTPSSLVYHGSLGL
jgi:hypothetical protein